MKSQRSTPGYRGTLSGCRCGNLSTFQNSLILPITIYHALYHEAGFRTGDIVTWSDFEKLPIVDKKMLVDNRSALCASIGFAPDNHHVARTSGSSGINFTIVQDDTSVDTRVVLNLRQTEMMVGHALSPDDWRYGIYLASERFTSLAGGYPVITVGQDCPAVDVFEHIQKIKPKILYAFPSYLKRLQVCAGDLTEWGGGVHLYELRTEHSRRAASFCAPFRRAGA
ncbi:CapK domain protein [Pseudomonas syringae pv. coriandricola]|uniref:CapK domain protein n=1 Tax=Pseudomonas syringae pv. coriandricola TaxID=264453 RepID=A0A3M5RTE8_9PSED|nr:CapK domain protein [Pseudomonas syringae pv. coriandricola]